MVDLAQSELYKHVPLGDNVAREFPWWREGQMRVPAGVAFRSQRYSFGPNATSLRNDREKPIKIHELRWITDSDGARYAAGSMLHSVQIFHSKYDIVHQWIPLACMNTEPDRGFWGDAASAMFKLPAPYFLQRGQAFMLELRPLTAAVDSENIEICLRGWDPYNKTPCVMSKVVTLPAVNAFVKVVFDDNRDSATRSMWIHDITFAFTEIDAASLPRSVTDQIRVRFFPGSGPRWTDDEVTGTRLSGLVHDDSFLSAGGVYRPTVIHRPVTPYILQPRETLTIKLRVDVALANQDRYWVWVIGTQPGRY